MDINKIEPEKVALIRDELIKAIGAMSGAARSLEGMELPDTADCEAVYDFMVERGKTMCDCPKHQGIEIVSTSLAVIFHDLVSKGDLEWSDKQKSELAKMMFALVSLCTGVIITVHNATVDNWKRKAAILSLLSASDPGAVADSLLQVAAEHIAAKKGDEPESDEPTDEESEE